MVLYTNEQLPRENYVFEIRIRDLRTKPKKRDSLPQCFVSRNMKHPGKYAGLFRETKRRRKSCFVSVVSLPTCFNSGPNDSESSAGIPEVGNRWEFPGNSLLKNGVFWEFPGIPIREGFNLYRDGLVTSRYHVLRHHSSRHYGTSSFL